MITKIAVVPRIKKIRVINVYEADYNLMFKYFWTNKATKHAVKNKIIGEKKWGVFPEEAWI